MTGVWEICGVGAAVVAAAVLCARDSLPHGIRALVVASRATEEDDASAAATADASADASAANPSFRPRHPSIAAFVEDATDVPLRRAQRRVEEGRGVTLQFAVAFVSEALEECEEKAEPKESAPEDASAATERGYGGRFDPRGGGGSGRGGSGASFGQTICPTVGIASPHVLAWTESESHEMIRGSERVLCCCVAGASV